jgi:prepilin-type processing-associated H-X9-DG protein
MIGGGAGWANNQQGMFNLWATTKIRDITDGTSNTLMFGEGTGGLPKWRMTKPNTLTSDPANGGVTAWLFGNFSSTSHSAGTGEVAGLAGSTANQLNLNPIVTTYYQFPAGLGDCRSSANGGTATVANFRSDHTGGGNFTLADGSVRFISANVSMVTYKAISTIQGNEVAGDF